MLEEFNRALQLAVMRIIDGIANFLPGALVLLVLVVSSRVVGEPGPREDKLDHV